MKKFRDAVAEAVCHRPPFLHGVTAKPSGSVKRFLKGETGADPAAAIAATQQLATRPPVQQVRPRGAGPSGGPSTTPAVATIEGPYEPDGSLTTVPPELFNLILDSVPANDFRALWLTSKGFPHAVSGYLNVSSVLAVGQTLNRYRANRQNPATQISWPEVLATISSWRTVDQCQLVSVCMQFDRQGLIQAGDLAQLGKVAAALGADAKPFIDQIAAEIKDLPKRFGDSSILEMHRPYMNCLLRAHMIASVLANCTSLPASTLASLRTLAMDSNLVDAYKFIEQVVERSTQNGVGGTFTRSLRAVQIACDVGRAHVDRARGHSALGVIEQLLGVVIQCPHNPQISNMDAASLRLEIVESLGAAHRRLSTQERTEFERRFGSTVALIFQRALSADELTRWRTLTTHSAGAD